ncbi:hypothetical protein Trydic_g7761 [Trypoxylus dichotomus]
MLRGLQANWKLPCHDQAANNVAGVNYLKKDTKAIYTRQNRAYDGSILIGNIKIFNIFDVPHLLKTVRNNLLNADLAFKVNGQVEVASWRHIEQMYEEDKGKDIRAVPNLTDFHIKRDKIRKTKVKYCSQVFSQRVTSQIQMLVDYAPEDVIHQDARHTVQILHFFNQLFDSMNSKARNHQYCRRVPGSSITALHSAKADRSSVYFCNTPERREPLDLGGLDVASVRMATPTVCCRTPVRDPVLAEVDVARQRQPTPRANLDTMVCKFLVNQVMLNVTPPPGGRFRVDSKVITMRQEHNT